MKTIGKGIVRQDLDYTAILVALLCSGFFVTLATFYRIPTSTSQAIVGGVFGIGLAVRAEIDYSKLITIAESWLICPIMVMVPDDFKPDFLNIAEVSMSMGESLKYAVLCYVKGVCAIEVSRSHAKDIGLMESKVDSLEWDLTKKIFTYEMDFARKIHLRLCLDHIVVVSDRAEESAGQLDLVTLKSMI